MVKRSQALAKIGSQAQPVRKMIKAKTSRLGSSRFRHASHNASESHPRSRSMTSDTKTGPAGKATIASAGRKSPHVETVSSPDASAASNSRVGSQGKQVDSSAKANSARRTV